MKWLVFSDSHGRWEYMKQAVELEKPDRVLHLGDMTRDAQRLLKECPGLLLEQVRRSISAADKQPKKVVKSN